MYEIRWYKEFYFVKFHRSGGASKDRKPRAKVRIAYRWRSRRVEVE